MENTYTLYMYMHVCYRPICNCRSILKPGNECGVYRCTVIIELECLHTLLSRDAYVLNHQISWDGKGLCPISLRMLPPSTKRGTSEVIYAVWAVVN